MALRRKFKLLFSFASDGHELKKSVDLKRGEEAQLGKDAATYTHLGKKMSSATTTTMTGRTMTGYSWLHLESLGSNLITPDPWAR